MKVLNGFKKVMEFVVVMIMVMMVIVIFLATVGRYSGLFSIPWSEEFARYCMVAMVYLASMIAASRGAHFVVEVVPMIFPKKVVDVISIIDAIIVDLFALFVAKQGWGISAKMLGQGKLTPMLEWPLGAVYLLIPIGIVLMGIYYTVAAIEKVKAKEEKKEA